MAIGVILALCGGARTALAAAADAKPRGPYELVENFSAALASSDEVACHVDEKAAKVGLAAGRVEYRLRHARAEARLWFRPERHRLSGPGTLVVWIKGDGSGNLLRLDIRHARASTDARGRRRYDKTRDERLPPVKLDFDEWREVSFDLRKLPAGRSVWWHGLIVSPGPGIKEPKLAGAVGLDDMRLFPLKPKATAAVAAGLLGPSMRVDTAPMRVFLDGRNFTGRPATLRARLTATDRSENTVAERSFDVPLAAGEVKEVALDLAAENVGLFLPPFRIAGDVLSPELPEVAVRIDETLVQANSRLLWETFSDVRGGWLTRGYEGEWGRLRSFTVGETYRLSPFTQTSVRVSRVDLAGTLPKDAAPANRPPAAYAMRVDFDGDGAVFNGRDEADRCLPGNAFRAGFWVKGDGSGATLKVIVHDHSDMADFWAGGWKRVEDERTLCVLDFETWRYIEIDLPGGGVGTNTHRGSTEGIDFPLEIAAFRIDARPAKRNDPPRRGTVWLGPILAWTQQRLAETLTVAVACDDPNHAWTPAAGATVTVQNAWPGGERSVRADWALLDRGQQVLAKGAATLALGPTEARTFRVDLAPHAAAIAKATGPLALAVTAVDAKDASIAATRTVVLAKPDSHVMLADFEADRGYLGTRAYGIAKQGQRPAPVGTLAARTSADRAHGGKRSLAIVWDRQSAPERFVAVDPPIPGVPVSLTMWVFGDGSGVVLYPLIGDRRGVNKGTTLGQWDFFLPRAEAGGPQNAVRVDWTGWKKVRFRLPIVPPTWKDDLPVRSFVPSYPLGLHLAVLAKGAKTASGTVYVDDVEVETHLAPDGRLDMTLEEPGETNVLPPGSGSAVWVANYDGSAAATVRLRGGVFDWRGTRVGGGPPGDIQVPPGGRVRVPIASAVPPGAYSVRIELLAGDAVRAAIDYDLLVADLKELLGDGWRSAVENSWKLRAPVDDRLAFVDEDWDWAERYPGNFQADTAIQRARKVRAGGGEPMMLLGYSAYWAAGIGYEKRKANAFSVRLRDEGHAVDVFLVPERIDDWDNYVCEMMRRVGAEVAGWVAWDNPDGSGPLGMTAERFAPMLAAADRWRRVYCPKRPLLIGGMNRETAVRYIERLAAAGAGGHYTGVNVRLDVGRLSPEDAQVIRYTRRLKEALKGTAREPKSILYTDLDWAVEKDPRGLSGFDQAAYLARSAMLMAGVGIQPALSIANEDTDRLGLGLTYRRRRSCPPLVEKPSTYLFKPAWWAMVNARRWLRQAKFVAEIDVADVVPGRTRCCLFRDGGGRPVAAVWRNDNPGQVRFARAGLNVASAEDLLGSRPTPDAAGWWPVGKVPTMFVLTGKTEPAAEALARLWVRDGKESSWPQRVLAAFAPSAAGGKRVNYRSRGTTVAKFAGRTADGDSRRVAGVRFGAGGAESFEIADLAAGAGLVLRKGWFLDKTGQTAEVNVNGKPAGTWDLRRSEKELSAGLREAVFVVPKAMLGGGKATIGLKYPRGGNTTRWTVLEYPGGPLPLTALGPVHADQNVARPRLGRNILGSRLKVGEQSFELGIGCFAQSLLEYPLDGRFKRFTATVGIDAAAEGRGSVVFEVHADGKKLWTSSPMSGLDAPKKLDLPVKGVRRLRLIVTDGGDGNRYDAADWCEPTLYVQE